MELSLGSLRFDNNFYRTVTGGKVPVNLDTEANSGFEFSIEVLLMGEEIVLGADAIVDVVVGVVVGWRADVASRLFRRHGM